MDAGQLKQLAARLRTVLDYWHIAVSHGQALDLVAALPGLRDWPEVIAFPDRLAAREIDLAATGRLARRIAERFAERLPARVACRLDAKMLMTELAPWTVVEPRAGDGRELLAVACGDSACGALRGAAIADRVTRTAQELVWGPVPAQDDPAAFLAARLAAWDADHHTSDQPEPWERDLEAPELPRHRTWEQQLHLFSDHERIELWMDPRPNAQLQLIQLLDWLRRDEGLARKVSLVQSDQPLGNCSALEIREMRSRARPIGSREFELAARAWQAFRQPTPQAWAALLASDLDALPHLRATVRALLAELPDARTGLRATERRLLERVAEPGASWMSVFPNMLRFDPIRVFDYWKLGRLLDGLARGDAPAITGLPDTPSSLALRDEARKRYEESTLRLSLLGEALLRGEDDILRHRPPRFWWGGTLLTPERAWRWDASTGRLDVAAP